MRKRILMDLKTLCMENIVEIIKNLPHLLKEEVIGESLKSIREDAEKKAKESLMCQIRRDAEIIMEDTTERLVRCHHDGSSWSRPDYTKNIDDELYYTFVHISEKFVHKYAEQIVFTPCRYRKILMSDEDEDEDEDDWVYGSESD